MMRNIYNASTLSFVLLAVSTDARAGDLKEITFLAAVNTTPFRTYFAHWGIGPELSTEIGIFNPSSTETAVAYFQAYDDNGRPAGGSILGDTRRGSVLHVQLCGRL